MNEDRHNEYWEDDYGVNHGLVILVWASDDDDNDAIDLMKMIW